MTTTGYKRLAIVLSALLIIFSVAGVGMIRDLTLLHLRVAFAADQTAIFNEMRAKALNSEPTEAAECLRYAVNYYPSGTKLETGSRLDLIVERQRADAVRDIIAYLRSKTGQDLGDDPQAWIKQFAGK